MSNPRSGQYGMYYGSLYEESEPLTQAHMETNSEYIYKALTAAGWTKQSIAAILGNMQAESTINPGRWQSDLIGNTSGGYSLVQWTPATKYTEWCTGAGYSDPSEMDAAIARILYEVENEIQWIPTGAHDMTFWEFTRNTATPSELAKAFLLNYERPADQSEAVQAYRGSLANSWYSYLTGTNPGTPGTPTKPRKKKKYNFILFGNKPWRNRQWH